MYQLECFCEGCHKKQAPIFTYTDVGLVYADAKRKSKEHNDVVHIAILARTVIIFNKGILKEIRDHRSYYDIGDVHKAYDALIDVALGD